MHLMMNIVYCVNGYSGFVIPCFKFSVKTMSSVTEVAGKHSWVILRGKEKGG